MMKGYSIDNYGLSSFSIPVRSELLELTGYSYEAAIILNQILYFYEKNHRKSKLNIYHIKRITKYPKTPQTLRKVLLLLENMGFIIKSGKTYDLANYQINENFLRPEKEELISLIESKDLEYLDYHSAAIVNFFRHSLIEFGLKAIYISAKELKRRLRLDISVSTIRTKLEELESANLIKRVLIGRKYNYELVENELTSKGLALLQSLSDELSSLLKKHCEKFGYYVAHKNNIAFRRMLDNGYAYDDIKHIIAYLCVADIDTRRRYYTANHIGKYFEKLLAKARAAVSKHKVVRIISKLMHGQIIKKFHDKEQSLSHEKIWMEATGWLETQNAFVYKCYYENKAMTTIADDGSDFNDFYYELLVAIVSAAIKHNVSPLSFEREYIKKTIQAHAMHKFRSQSTDVMIDEIMDSIEVAQKHFEPLKYNELNVPDYLAHIPYEELEVIMKYYLKSEGKMTVAELAIEYGFSVGKISRVINNTFDEVKRLHYEHHPPAS